MRRGKNVTILYPPSKFWSPHLDSSLTCFRDYITSNGLRALYEGPETLTGRVKSDGLTVTGVDARDTIASEIVSKNIKNVWRLFFYQITGPNFYFPYM